MCAGRAQLSHAERPPRNLCRSAAAELPAGRPGFHGCSGVLMAPFFIPTADGQAGERSYQQLREEVELRMGRAPNRRRIMELWTRRGSLDLRDRGRRA